MTAREGTMCGEPSSPHFFTGLSLHNTSYARTIDGQQKGASGCWRLDGNTLRAGPEATSSPPRSSVHPAAPAPRTPSTARSGHSRSPTRSDAPWLYRLRFGTSGLPSPCRSSTRSGSQSRRPPPRSASPRRRTCPTGRTRRPRGSGWSAPWPIPLASPRPSEAARCRPVACRLRS